MIKKISCKVVGSETFVERRQRFRDVSQLRIRHCSSSVTYTRQMYITEVSHEAFGGYRLDCFI